MIKNVLTKSLVLKLGLNRVEHITAEMLDGYTEISEHAFYLPNIVKTIVLPNSVTRIAARAFLCCGDLEEITIPDSVRYIGCGAFGYCCRLKQINIPDSIRVIYSNTFYHCRYLKNIRIPKDIRFIHHYAFDSCRSIHSVTIGDVEYKTQVVKSGKCKAYKAIGRNMTCLNDFKYEEGKTYEIDEEPKICERGFHACLRLSDIFNYYSGQIGRDIYIYEVELDGVSDGLVLDSKVVAKKITIGKRIL